MVGIIIKSFYFVAVEYMYERFWSSTSQTQVVQTSL